MRADSIAESWSHFDDVNESEDGADREFVEENEDSDAMEAEDSSSPSTPKRTTPTKQQSLGDSISSGLSAVAESLALMSSARAQPIAPAVDLRPILQRIDSMQQAQAQAQAEQSKINAALLQALQNLRANK